MIDREQVIKELRIAQKWNNRNKIALNRLRTQNLINDIRNMLYNLDEYKKVKNKRVENEK